MLKDQFSGIRATRRRDVTPLALSRAGGVVVVPHQNVGMNLHTETLGHLAQQIEEMQTEGIIQEDHATLDPARHHMIPPALNIYA